MEFFVSLKNLVKKIEKIDKKTKKLFEEKIYSTNPFAINKDQTIIWLDEVKDNNMCRYFDANNIKENKD